MGIPLVSVIMNCLNGAHYVSHALDTVFSQTYPHWEIIFWDNGSTDESSIIAKRYGEKVRCFKSDVTTTLGEARNNALAKCQGEYVAFLDVDDLWLPEKLEQQVSLFEQNPKLGLVFSDSLLFNEKGDQYRLFELFVPKRGIVFGELLKNNFMQTVTIMYRKDALASLPYVFDNRFTMAMDYDLSLRVAYFYEIDYVDRPLCKWRMHPGSESNRKRFLMPKENQIVIEKLRRELPDIETRYKDEVHLFLKAFVHRQLAFEQWDEGNRARARAYLSPYLKDPTCLLTYVSTWIFPFSVFDRIKTLSVNKLLWYIRRGNA
ncbi:MAG: glycosyltransferase family 2 protein [bacterium]